LTQLQRALRKAGQKLPLDIALRIFLDALAGLHAAHELTGAEGMPLNLVHRDVSPQNILVSVDGIARITDFGVARAEARLQSTHGGQLKGKLGYMAPEQLRREMVDRRADIYAAGVLFWELVTGAKLIDGENEAQILVKNMAGDHPAPRTVNPALPEPLNAACMRALHILREERYATAADFAEAVDEAVAVCRVTVASPRAVAALVKRLGAHVSPDDLLGGSTARADAARSIAGTPAPSGPTAAPARTAVTTIEGDAARSSATSSSGMSVPPGAPRTGKVLTGVLAGVGLLALGVAAAWSLRDSAHSLKPSAPAAAAAAPPERSPAPTAEAAPPTSMTATDPPPPPVTIAAPTESAASAPVAPRPWPRKSGGGSGGKTTKSPIYRPPEL
jgi:serine/threonine-protein kinase